MCACDNSNPKKEVQWIDGRAPGKILGPHILWKVFLQRCYFQGCILIMPSQLHRRERFLSYHEISPSWRTWIVPYTLWVWGNNHIGYYLCRLADRFVLRRRHALVARMAISQGRRTHSGPLPMPECSGKYQIPRDLLTRCWQTQCPFQQSIPTLSQISQWIKNTKRCANRCPDFVLSSDTTRSAPGGFSQR